MFPRFRNTGLTIRISKNAALKILLIFGSIFGAFLMTGLLYFRNDVQIIDENEKRIVYTVSDDPYEILRENHITLDAYDRIEFTGFEEDVATATLSRERLTLIYLRTERRRLQCTVWMQRWLNF